MTHGHFLWTDLSTYDMASARADYAELFGWSFNGYDTYDFATSNGQEVAAVFPMPKRLAEMDMPSFWMSYVHVENVEALVEKARQHEGVIIEVEPQSFSEDARVALVRDPSGAGFTLYEGPEITTPSGGAGQIAMRYHHVSDVGIIEPFYRDLFGWLFARTTDSPWPTYDIMHLDGTRVAQAEEVPETIRGKFRYWMPCFSVPSVQTTLATLAASGGEAHSDLSDGRTLVADQQGAHFMIRATEEQHQTSMANAATYKAAPRPTFAWKALIGLLCIWLAVFLDVQAFWGVLFLIWTWPAIKTGRADFIEPVSRAYQPFTYWALISTWVILSLWLIASPWPMLAALPGFG